MSIFTSKRVVAAEILAHQDNSRVNDLSIRLVDCGGELWMLVNRVDLNTDRPKCPRYLIPITKSLDNEVAHATYAWYMRPCMEGRNRNGRVVVAYPHQLKCGRATEFAESLKEALEVRSIISQMSIPDDGSGAINDFLHEGKKTFRPVAADLEDLKKRGGIVRKFDFGIDHDNADY